MFMRKVDALSSAVLSCVGSLRTNVVGCVTVCGPVLYFGATLGVLQSPVPADTSSGLLE